MNREEMIKELIDLQNTKTFWNQDILTILGFMKQDNEVLEHLMRCTIRHNRASK